MKVNNKLVKVLKWLREDDEREARKSGMSQKERGQYAVMKRNQRKALRRKFHVEDSVLISNL